MTLNPVELVDFEPLDNERTRTLERADLDKLLAESSKLSRARYMHTLLLLLWHTGFRISHALRLRWDEMHLVDALVVTTPDKGATKVTLPLHDELSAPASPPSNCSHSASTAPTRIASRGGVST